ncbi:MAG: YcaO-like family protein, partial [Bacteroidota bacterium]
PTITDAVQCCISAAEEAGLETLVLDLTQPDICLPVAKVMVPGLRHFWRRTAPGRLYDVPVKMGWLDVPNQEDELNPLSIFI